MTQRCVRTFLEQQHGLSGFLHSCSLSAVGSATPGGEAAAEEGVKHRWVKHSHGWVTGQPHVTAQHQALQRPGSQRSGNRGSHASPHLSRCPPHTTRGGANEREQSQWMTHETEKPRVLPCDNRAQQTCQLQLLLGSGVELSKIVWIATPKKELMETKDNDLLK